jgi:DNA-binding transcriptional LysR family regulator
MNERQLRHFATVAETLHFGRAADRLGITQPPLSQSIQALERRLGAPLFERTRRSVALTPFGAEWLPKVQAALQGMDELQGSAGAILSGEVGHLELSFVSTAVYSILPDLVHRFRTHYPDIGISLTEATTDMQITALAENKAQVGLIILDRETPLAAHFDYRALVKEPLVAAVPETWLREGRLRTKDGALRPGEVISSPLIVFPRRVAPSYYDLVIDYYKAYGGTAHVLQHAVQMQTIISLVSAGMGIALVPASLKNLKRAGVRYLDLRDEVPEIETGMVWCKGNTTTMLDNFLDAAKMYGVNDT